MLGLRPQKHLTTRTRFVAACHLRQVRNTKLTTSRVIVSTLLGVLADLNHAFHSPTFQIALFCRCVIFA